MTHPSRVACVLAALLLPLACARQPPGDAPSEAGPLAARHPGTIGPSAPFDDIVFFKGPFSDEELFSIEPDGTGLTRLTDNTLSDTDPAWFPRGPRLVFARGFGGLWTLNIRSGRTARLTLPSTIPGSDAWPAVSPTGSRIAFTSSRDGGDWDIFVMNANGTGVTPLTDNADSDRNPNWSPDGDRIVFESGRDGDDDIYVMNADGSGVVQLTNDPDQDIRPDFSPDGSRIAFASNRDANPEIWSMNPDGSGLQQITFTELLINSDPSGSPDGSRIVFSRRVPDTGDADIWIVDVANGNETRLTSDGNGNRDPDWRP